MNIRIGTKSDISTITHYNIAMAMETENKSLHTDVVHKGVTAVINDETKGFYLLAIDGDMIIGQLMITTEWSDWRNGYFWWIQSVYVHPDYRKRGVFRSLFLQAKDLAQHNGSVCGLRLYVDESNENAQRVYSSLGWKNTEYRFYEMDWS